MQKITVEEVKAACRREFKAKNLLMFHFHGTYGYGGIRTQHHPCAIGSVLTPETLDEIGDRSLHEITLSAVGSEESHSIGEVISWDEDEQEELFKIQKLHDEACYVDLVDSTIQKDVIDKFKTAIGL